jgi:hypothetical protein
MQELISSKAVKRGRHSQVAPIYRQGTLWLKAGSIQYSGHYRGRRPKVLQLARLKPLSLKWHSLHATTGERLPSYSVLQLV